MAWTAQSGRGLLAALLVLGTLAGGAASVDGDESDSLAMIVMDPLAAPLSCPCVEGYAQRKYEVLAAHLESRLGRKVTLVFAESLAKALKETGGRADLVIGKDSVVRSDAARAQRDMVCVARLTDSTGSTVQHGLLVVAQADPARTLADLRGYTIYFGPEDCAEKHQAALAALAAAQVTPDRPLALTNACSDGACKVVEAGRQGRSAAVISSYAAPLLEGCGTIKKGDLRVVGKTAPVPFVAAFVSRSLGDDLRGRVTEELLGVGAQLELCTALESLLGFVAPDEPAPAVPAVPAVPAAKKK